MDAAKELEQIVERLEKLAQRGDSAEIHDPLSALQESAERVGRAASGSWLGYHAFVYYEGLNKPPPDAHFDPEWGLMDRPFSNRTSGHWKEYTHEVVVAAIHGRAGSPDLGPARMFDDDARDEVEVCKSEMLSILQSHSNQDDHLDRIRREIDETSLVWPKDVIEQVIPRSKLVTSDHLAANGGQQTPPHIDVWAEVISINHTRGTILGLTKLVKRAASHISRQQAVTRRRSTAAGTNVFIGHGHSDAWRELKDFIEGRLGLQTDEFNRVPVAGVPNTRRLEEMLSSAAMAFLVMTGEDEQHDGKSHARLNVVHEAGLFQGRLGFERAIVLLEDGCEGFSNIDGSGQLRFPKGEIKSKFEQIRQVLEREGLVKEGEK